MTYAATPQGLYFPYLTNINFGTGSLVALNAAGEMCAMIGKVYIEDRVSSKTIDTTGSSAIQFRTGGVTFNNGSTSLSIGIQDLSTDGPAGQPDGTFDVSTIATSAAPPSANAWNSFAMTGGTKTINHGQLIAVVWDMTGRGGADSVQIAPGTNNKISGLSYFTTNIDGAGWLTSLTSPANCVITFSDGTLGYLDYAMPISTSLTEQYLSTTDPDERALIFQVPWNCKIDAVWANVGGQSSTAAFNWTLYSDPLGTPTSMVSSAVVVGQLGASVSSQRVTVFNLSTEQILTRNTDYAVAIMATGGTSTRILGATLGDAGHRTFFPGGTTLRKATRSDGTGAFGSQVSTSLYQFGVRISQLDDGDGTASGSAGVMYNPSLTGT